MKRTISKNEIVLALRELNFESVNFETSKNLILNQIQAQLTPQKQFNVLHFIYMKNKSMYYKCAVIAALLITAGVTISVVQQPARAKEVIQNLIDCGVNQQCYETKRTYEGAYGTFEETNLVDINGKKQSNAISTGNVDYQKIYSVMEAVVQNENNESKEYKFPGGTIINWRKDKTDFENQRQGYFRMNYEEKAMFQNELWKGSPIHTKITAREVKEGEERSWSGGEVLTFEDYMEVLPKLAEKTEYIDKDNVKFIFPNKAVLTLKRGDHPNHSAKDANYFSNIMRELGQVSLKKYFTNILKNETPISESSNEKMFNVFSEEGYAQYTYRYTKVNDSTYEINVKMGKTYVHIFTLKM